MYNGREEIIFKNNKKLASQRVNLTKKHVKSIWEKSEDISEGHKSRLRQTEKYIVILEKKINNINLSVFIMVNYKFYDPIKIPTVFFSGTRQADLKDHKKN